MSLTLNLQQEILRVLLEAGPEGLPVKKISRHVYNACNNLFNHVDYADVHQRVVQYLSKASKSPYSAICHGQRRGWYQLNPGAKETHHLMLEFQEEQEANAKEDDKGELSLSLFD